MIDPDMANTGEEGFQLHLVIQTIGEVVEEEEDDRDEVLQILVLLPVVVVH